MIERHPAAPPTQSGGFWITEKINELDPYSFPLPNP